MCRTENEEQILKENCIEYNIKKCKLAKSEEKKQNSTVT
jgi:hypothetical protein